MEKSTSNKSGRPAQKIRRFCCYCGTPFPVLLSRAKTKPATFCSTKCHLAAYNELHSFTGENNPRWNGGRIELEGYVYVKAKDHPFGNRHGYVPEHRLIAERALGKFIDPKHPVHHFNEIRCDNANQNLVICEDGAYHSLLHTRTNQIRRGAEIGITKWCYKCEVVLPISDFGKSSREFDGRARACAKCSRSAANTNYARRVSGTYVEADCTNLLLEVAEIRRLYATGLTSKRKLAKQFNRSYGTIHRIVHGRWALTDRHRRGQIGTRRKI